MNPGNLLLVEDNPEDEMLALRALKKALPSTRIDVARDGQQALHYLFKTDAYANCEGPDLPAVVLLDISLPRLSGLEVLEHLRADPRTACLPVVMLTSSDEPRDRARSYALGCNSFVQKPVEFAAHADTLARLGTYWLAINEPPSGCAPV